eukprot:TRINITY_DN7315_c0_g1_i1.p1 TRINITY_DN7315_c0_g1~~TRINITY_DN7315_c0_g1_i1.p1  ORF type:complete len:202 (-),score=28.61 TRINITY_DN7315_c0_g1_i1:112-717(-)
MMPRGIRPDQDNAMMQRENAKENDYLCDRFFGPPNYPPKLAEEEAAVTHRFWLPSRGEHVVLNGLRRGSPAAEEIGASHELWHLVEQPKPSIFAMLMRRNRQPELNGVAAEVFRDIDAEGFVMVRLRDAVGGESFKKIQASRLRPYGAASLPSLKSSASVASASTCRSRFSAGSRVTTSRSTVFSRSSQHMLEASVRGTQL